MNKSLFKTQRLLKTLFAGALLVSVFFFAGQVLAAEEEAMLPELEADTASVIETDLLEAENVEVAEDIAVTEAIEEAIESEAEEEIADIADEDSADGSSLPEPEKQAEDTNILLNDEQIAILTAIDATLVQIEKTVAVSDEYVFESEEGVITLPPDTDPLPTNEKVSAELTLEAGSIPEEGDQVVDGESDFMTEAETTDPTDEEAGAEMSFRTLPCVSVDISNESFFGTLPPTPAESVSGEYFFNTLSDEPEDVVGAEGVFKTLSGSDDPEDPTISGEFFFVTLDIHNDDEVSAESSFVTASIPTPSDDKEYFFDTLLNNPVPNTSGEFSFTTGSGGGGGGGGGGGILTTTTTTPATTTPMACARYLKKFIRFGRDNDRLEVLKLQLFLKHYEKMNVPISGVYDLQTMRAVERFQARYGQDVLGPWGITDSTGYVFITTTYAINHIYCGLDTANDIDLRNIIQEFEQITGERLAAAPAGGNDEQTAVATATVIAKSDGINAVRLLAALGALGGFMRDNLCWLLDLLLLAIVVYLLWLVFRSGQGTDETTADALSPEDFAYLNQIAESEESPATKESAMMAGAAVIQPETAMEETPTPVILLDGEVGPQNDINNNGEFGGDDIEAPVADVDEENAVSPAQAPLLPEAAGEVSVLLEEVIEDEN